jgi:tryptophan-rich sensory protein
MPNQRKHSRCKEAFKSISVLLLSFLVTFAAGAVGALASISAQKTYVMIQQPSWAPPAWIFGPV